MSNNKFSDLLAGVTRLFSGSGGRVSASQLSSLLGVAARKFHVPGIAVGVWYDGNETFAAYGVTNINDPQPIANQTLFLTASITKTFTATAIMHLVNEGKVDVHAPVKHYIPELQLSDHEAAEHITILHLLNHTSGLDWRLDADTGEGDDALQQFVAHMADVKQIHSVGTRANYSQAGYDLLGRVIEKVTGTTYEHAITALLLEPLGLTNSSFALADIRYRQFASGHNVGDDGKLSVAKLWKYARAENPGGGLASSSVDLLQWAKFHLGIVKNEGVLPTTIVKEMQQPTAELVGSSLGKAIGISWFLSDMNGVQTVRHSGSANGQFAELFLVPERKFAVVSLCNAGPNGIRFNEAVVQWTLQKYLGLVERAPKSLPFDAARAQEVIGTYENEIQVVTVAVKGKHMTIAAGIKQEIRAASAKELPADYPPANMGFLPGNNDEYVITNGGLQGQRGSFTRDKSGVVVGIDLAGRLFSRILAVSA